MDSEPTLTNNASLSLSTFLFIDNEKAGRGIGPAYGQDNRDIERGSDIVEPVVQGGDARH